MDRALRLIVQSDRIPEMEKSLEFSEGFFVFEVQCIVTKGHFPANKGRMKKATNGHITAIGPPTVPHFLKKRRSLSIHNSLEQRQRQSAHLLPGLNFIYNALYV